MIPSLEETRIKKRRKRPADQRKEVENIIIPEEEVHLARVIERLIDVKTISAERAISFYSFTDEPLGLPVEGETLTNS
jgi:hypothetical protein